MFRNNKDNKCRDFKKGIDAYDARKNRENVTVALRKKDRNAHLQKRRMMRGAAAANAPQAENNPNAGNQLQDPNTQAKLTDAEVKQRLDNIGQLVAAVNGRNENAATRAVTEFRRLLSVERKPPIQQVIDTGIVPRLVCFLSAVKNQRLQFEAAWTLTNIASGSSVDTTTVVKANAIPSFVALLRSPNAEVREQAVWALGNIAGDSASYRDMVLGAGGLPALIFLIKHPQSKLTMVRNATWTMSNLCRGKPQPPLEAIRPAIGVLQSLIQHSDVEVLTDACWALSYISDDNGPSNAKIQAVLDAGMAPLLCTLLKHKSNAVQVPALRAVGNIVTGDDTQTQTILNCQPLPNLLRLLDKAKKTIKKEACWALSNITAGTAPQIQEVQDANLIPPLIQLMRSSGFDIRKEAAWAISNITSGGTDQQVQYLVGQGVIPALCGLFEYPDAKIVTVALEGIENILTLGARLSTDDENNYAYFVNECGGLDSLETLQTHDNEDIYTKALSLLQTHFVAEDEDDNAPEPTMDASSDQFSFAMTPSAAPGMFSF